MASETSLARRYASALAALAEEAGTSPTVSIDLDRAWSAFDADRGRLLEVMVNPGFTVAERRAVLDAVLPPLGLDVLVNNLLYLLLDKNRFGVFAELVVAYRVLMDARAGRLRATVTTPTPLDEAGRRQITEVLAAIGGNTVQLSVKEDPSLIAGLVLQVGDTVYDASLKSRLATMRSLLLDPHGAGATEP